MGRHPKEFQNFDRFMTRLLAVPHDTIKERMDRYDDEAKKNPRRRGPKPKSTRVTATPSGASRGPADDD